MAVITTIALASTVKYITHVVLLIVTYQTIQNWVLLVQIPFFLGQIHALFIVL